VSFSIPTLPNSDVPRVLLLLIRLARAKTGTGKTLAFMVPAIERLSRLPRPPAAASISVLVLSPTRELAIQIEKETLPLLKGTPFGVQHVVGGTNKNAEARRLRNERADILVAVSIRGSVKRVNCKLTCICRRLGDSSTISTTRIFAPNWPDFNVLYSTRLIDCWMPGSEEIWKRSSGNCPIVKRLQGMENSFLLIL
jgi:hypothetical protein